MDRVFHGVVVVRTGGGARGLHLSACGNHKVVEAEASLYKVD